MSKLLSLNLSFKTLFIIFLVIFGLQSVSASDRVLIYADTTLPQVFLIGEFESEYEAAIEEYSTLLLTACEMDMELAYSKWVSMLEEIEIASENYGLDLKGVKIWLNVFWEPNGSISHLAYYLKPISRNVDLEELESFFVEFIQSYRFPLGPGEKFSHFGTASFPVFAKIMQPDKTQGNVTNGQ